MKKIKKITTSKKLKEKFPDLEALIFKLKGVKVKKEIPELEKFKEHVISEIKEKYSLEELKEDKIFRAYRDFFWKIKIDPTKIRPAAEALMRRILSEGKIPKINSLVDSYNLASIKTKISLAIFDLDKLTEEEELEMRFANKNEKFLGIGMKKEIELKGNEIVISDMEKLIAIYPYRDSERTKISLETKNILMLVCGVPKIEEEELVNAGELTVEYIKKFCLPHTLI
jgi:DNA/RNA-binding domain of Phe-tRNA-synthetase-like protein